MKTKKNLPLPIILGTILDTPSLGFQKNNQIIEELFYNYRGGGGGGVLDVFGKLFVRVKLSKLHNTLLCLYRNFI